MTLPSFRTWFKETTNFSPHPWQEELGAAPQCGDRLLRIPTGFGKTAGVVLPWLYHRVVRKDLTWPTRLVFTLPMRTLVEQTERVVREWLSRAGLDVGVHVLMGGAAAGPWATAPERPAILIGTQDMLLSRALNRGYGAARGRWPLELGLLHQDALWVLDEIQLMDVGLATSTQLAAFRQWSTATHHGALRPSFSWWMSATLQPSWLGTIDFRPHLATIERALLRIPAEQRQGGLWNVQKALRRDQEIRTPDAIAEAVRAGHRPGSLTLVIANTVRRAVDIHTALEKQFQAPGSKRKASEHGARAGAPDLRLIHSQFRGAERAAWANDFLSREAPVPPEGRIIVATQVVEAGVDISADFLVTVLAPWPSLVQRFGRVARYETSKPGQVLVVGPVPDDKDALPYSAPELAAADRALTRLLAGPQDVSPATLERFEEALAAEEPGLVRELYPYQPKHVLRRGDFLDLFDTTPDLTGTDLDVSRYIRGGEERDVTVFWRDVELPKDKKTFSHKDLAPLRREELCPVPIQDLRKWIEDRRSGASGAREYAFRLDYVRGEWVSLKPQQIVPGITVLIPSKAGGYVAERGWSPKHTGTVPEAQAPTASKPEAGVGAAEVALTRASEAAEGEPLSEVPRADGWKSIAEHGREVGEEVRALATNLGLESELRPLLDLAGRWHDVGKAHRVFQKAIKQEAREQAGAAGAPQDLAKAPEHAWRRPPYPERPGFRHELASTLALFELLRRANPNHPALLGEVAPVLAELGQTPVPIPEPERISGDHPLARELASLSAQQFNLVAWLVCTHHGKVRCGWTSTPKDQEAGKGAIFGVSASDTLPALQVAAPDGAAPHIPELALSLECAEMGLNARYGASWRERVTQLLETYGPFKLAYLEALLRAADVRVSQLTAEERP